MKPKPFSVGEFSRITGLSVKTLRFYHEKGILEPSSVDPATGYRYYDSTRIEKARMIRRLKELEFSLEEIGDILGSCEDEADVLHHLERQKTILSGRIRKDRDIVRALEAIIAREREARRNLEKARQEVAERSVEAVRIASVRMRGKYSECGRGFSRIGKALGRHICGTPFCLYHDAEYREDDADFEACFPIRKEVSAAGITVRMLPAARCLTLLHRGPYDQLGRSYAKILSHASQEGWKIALPTREVYLKGPGMIFRGNPLRYLTEIQLPFEAAAVQT
jgi:DNA-binding transcriptional MerR regulator